MKPESITCDHPEELIVHSVESDYAFCELCETQSQLRDARESEASLKGLLQDENAKRPVNACLFVIRLRGRQLYWQCSAEHGSGWHPNYPKQAFSKSELASQLRHMIENGVFADCEIVQLSLPKWTTEGDP